MKQYLSNFCREENGQDMIEYTLLITFIAIACAAMLSSPTGSIKAIWTISNNQLTAANELAAGS